MTPDTTPMNVTVASVPGPDFTIYEEFKDDSAEQASQTDAQDHESQTRPEHQQRSANLGDKKKNYAYEGSVAINEEGQEEPTSGRGLKCRAYGGKYWSITIRSDADNLRQPSDDYFQRLEKGLREFADKYPKKLITKEAKKTKTKDYLGYYPSGHPKYSNLFRKPVHPPDPLETSTATQPSTPTPEKEIFVNEIYQLCAELYDILLSDRTVTPTGLITLTGATNSSKSLIARGLIFLYLDVIAEEALKNKLRKPHLVTYEDPIEQYYIKDPNTQAGPATKDDLERVLDAFNIDYTPREKNKDADKLPRVIENAKRQTPAVFFVSETRDPRDWKDLLDFGGSGHLVITTSHAGSVVEAMTQIFRQTKTENPSQRSQIARRILGIVNIRSFNPIVPPNAGKTTPNVRALVPAVWKRTSQSVNNLVADGLSSILPALGREEEIGYFGRTYFAGKLTEKSSDEFKKCDPDAVLAEEIVRQAMEWDIGGF